MGIKESTQSAEIIFAKKLYLNLLACYLNTTKTQVADQDL